MPEETAELEVDETTGEVVEEVEREEFEFDDIFIDKILAHLVRDNQFIKTAHSMVRSEHFKLVDQQVIASIVLDHYSKYSAQPTLEALVQEVSDMKAKGTIRPELSSDLAARIRQVHATSIAGTAHVLDKVKEFVIKQETEIAFIKGVELFQRGEIAEAIQTVADAKNVGMMMTDDAYDYFENIEQRTDRRAAIASGAISARGISTGIPEIDKRLHHKGWGRSEVTLFLGASKAGKSTALGDFAKVAAMNGHNVLLVTLEVDSEIYSVRLDANISRMSTSKVTAPGDMLIVKEKIQRARAKAGKLMILERPTGRFSPNQLEATIEQHNAVYGINYDMVVLDYWDLMCSDRKYRDNPIAESKEVCENVRAIAQKYDVAMLTASQTNREGAKSKVAGLTHVADDYNKVRIADLIISINKEDSDRVDGTAVMHWAGSRTSQDGFSVKIQQDLDKMIFIDQVLDWTVSHS